MKKLWLYFTTYIFFSSISVVAQTIERNTYKTNRLTNEVPKIDGNASDEVWNLVDWATDFTQIEPNPGEKSKQNTKVKLLYNDDALYVLGVMTENEQIFTYLTERDDSGNADWFGILVDAYNEGTNGLGFFVTAAGVQLEAKYSGQSEDFAWNAVWESEVQVSENEWVVEMKIPYAALRFPTKEKQTWGLHFWRNRRLNRELSSWNTVKPDIDGFINQAGIVEGIENIKAPLRLQFFPYLTLGVNHFPNEAADAKDFSTNYAAGMDVKYGINDAFTLDMTLVPDFSQVIFDDVFLNLSPFEQRFNENRQFFTEGTELFNKAGLFYSRRIGGTPLKRGEVYNNLEENEIVSANPISNQLLNATKVSGRTSGGLGIGIFNAFEGSSFAEITNTETNELRKFKTSPYTNYNIVVLDQDLPGNSSVTITNTNVKRFDEDFYDANVSGFNSNFVSKDNKYSFRTELALSQKIGGDFEEPDLGYKAGASINKISGNFLSTLYYGIESDKYDPNDLGFLFSPNEKVWFAEVGYNIYEPFWKVNNLYSNVNVVYERLFFPDKFTNFAISGFARTTTNSFHTMGTGLTIEPVETFDFFEPRVFDFETFYQFPENFTWNAFFSSNYSKPFAFDINWNYRWFDEPNRWALNVNISPRFQPTSKLLIVPRLNLYKSNNETAYAGTFDEHIDGIPFGIRDVRKVVPLLQFDYVINNRMVLKTRIRHDWTITRYEQLGVLNTENGLFEAVEVSEEIKEIRDVNFHAFTVDIAYRWVFAPGSELSVVWKNNIVGSNFELEDRYLNSFEDMINSPIQKGLSVRMLYFLDSSYFKKLRKRT